MKRIAHEILVANLERIMRARGIPNQNQLAKTCKINQKTMAPFSASRTNCASRSGRYSCRTSPWCK